MTDYEKKQEDLVALVRKQADAQQIVMRFRSFEDVLEKLISDIPFAYEEQQVLSEFCVMIGKKRHALNWDSLVGAKDLQT